MAAVAVVVGTGSPVVRVADSGDVRLVTLAQTRQLAGATAVVRYDEREQPLTAGINGLIPVLVRLRRGVFTDIDLLVRDSAGRVLSTTTL